MIDLRDLRENPEKYLKGAADKHLDVDVNGLLEIDAQLRAVMMEREQLTAEKNRIGKEIAQIAGRLKRADEDHKSQLQQQMQQLQQRPSEIKNRSRS